MKELVQMRDDGTFDAMPKKEANRLRDELEKLERFLTGIKDMDCMPGALFIIDPRKENIAVLEGRKLEIPVVGIVDTNCDPDEIDYCIPGNDDAIRAVKLLTAKMADAVIEAKQELESIQADMVPGESVIHIDNSSTDRDLTEDFSVVESLAAIIGPDGKEVVSTMIVDTEEPVEI